MADPSTSSVRKNGFDNLNVIATALILLLMAQMILAETPKALTELTLTVVPSIQEGIGVAKATLIHSTFAESGTAEAVSEITGSRIDSRSLPKTEAYVPLQKAVIDLFFLDDRETSLRRIDICVGRETDANGIVTCQINIPGDSCGFIVAEFKGTEKDLPASDKQRYCFGRVPFGFVVDNTLLIVFFFFGLLAAGLYASGRNPLASLDITTPRVKGPYTFPTYMYRKVKLTKGIAKGVTGTVGTFLGRGKRVLSTVPLMSSFSKMGSLKVMSPQELKTAQMQMAGQPENVKYAMAVTFAARKYHELVKRIQTTRKQIDVLSTKGAKYKSRITTLKAFEKRLIDVKQKIAQAVEAPLRRMSASNFVETRVLAKEAETLAAINRSEWGESTWLDESKRILRLKVTAPEDAILVPVMDARLHLENSRLLVYERALEEIRDHGSETVKKRAEEISERRTGDKETIGQLLDVLRGVNSKLAEDLNRLYSRVLDSSESIGTLEGRILGYVVERSEALKIGDAAAVKAADTSLPDVLMESYDRAIITIAEQESYLRQLHLKGLENYWRGNDKQWIPPVSSVLIPGFAAIASPTTAQRYENVFSRLIQNALDAPERLLADQPPQGRRGLDYVLGYQNLEGVAARFEEKMFSRLKDVPVDAESVENVLQELKEKKKELAEVEGEIKTRSELEGEEKE